VSYESLLYSDRGCGGEACHKLLAYLALL